MKKIFFLLATLVVPLFAFAQAVPATATGATHPYSLGGNTYTFSGAQATAANSAKYSYAPAANGSIYTTNVASIPGASGGGAVPVTVNGSISKTAAAAAIGRFALKTTGVIGVLSLGVGLYDLGKELGFTLSDNNGVLGVTQTTIDPALCYQAPCYKWPLQQGGYTESKQVAAQSWCSYAYTGLTGCTFTVQPTPSQIIFTAFSASSCPTGCPSTVRYGVTGGAAVSPSFTPSTPQAFTDAVAAKPVWPPESAIARAVRDAVKSGESVAVTPVSVTGPASTTGARTVTNNGTSTTTNQTTNNYNYAGNTVSVTNVTTSTTINNTSGATEAQTTTTEQPVAKPDPEPQKDTCGMPGTPACKIDEAGTPDAYSSQKYDTAVDPYKATTDTNRATISGTGDKPFFTGWSVFFSAPALAVCAPIVLPGNHGSLNPCPVVDGVRYIMGLLWAAGGLVLCLGMVKQVV